MNNGKVDWKGAFVAVVTPFTASGEIDEAKFVANLELLISEGIHGLVISGCTGESWALEPDERLRLFKLAVKTANKKVTVVAGTGGISTKKVAELSIAAKGAGCDGVMILPPYYAIPSLREVHEHYRYINDQAKVPIMLYNIPGRCGVEIAIPTIARLRESHPNIVSVKHATGRVDDAAELLSVSNIEVLSGDDPITWPLMALGAIGVVSVMSNLCPRAVKRLTHAGLAGDFAAARAAHNALYPLMRGLLSLETNPIPIKTALAIKGLCSEDFRLPMCPIAPENRKKLTDLLERYPLD